MYKQLLSLAAILALTMNVNAQNTGFALKGGLNISTGKVKANGHSYSGTGIGFHAGVVNNIPVTENINLQPGALLSYKSAKVKDLSGIKIGLLTLDIPVMALYEKNNFFAGIGPSFNFGLTGKYKYSSDKYDLFDKDNEGRFSIKRFEIAANIMAGYKLKSGLFFSANFAPGLNNLFSNSKYTGRDTNVKTSVIGLSVGYPLGKK
jgi:hypothetical protein